MFASVIGLATLVDHFLEKNSRFLEELSAQEQNQEEKEPGFAEQISLPLNAKTTVQKAPEREYPGFSTNKFLLKFHQHRNYQVLKADRSAEINHSGFSGHLTVLLFYRDYLPGEEPLIG